MSESKTQPFIFAAAGVLVGAILTKIFMDASASSGKGHEETKTKSNEERKKEQRGKLTALNESSKKFIEGLTTHGDIAISKVPHLGETHELEVYQSPLLGDISHRDITGNREIGFLPEKAFSSPKKFIISGQSYSSHEDIAKVLKFLRAGPRKQIVFNPKEVTAAIVTCGGLCPGLNVVIRELVMCLWYNYGVRSIYGIKWGFRGFHDKKHIIPLEPKDVRDIHSSGGSWLGSSRGGFDEKVILQACKDYGINQLYIIGGDGTHRGIFKLYEYVEQMKEKITICGIPKTIDNDIPIIDKSFGFDSAVAAAEKMIEAANCEAESAENGVGLVKLMGRDCGYIAAFATLASRDVNFCLIPESPFEVEGDYGVCENVCKRLKSKGHCVIVVAEGADDAALDVELGKSGKADAGGHVKHADIGSYLKDRIVSYGKEKYGMEITLKYIDPTYAIRSVPANSTDTIMCTRLSLSSVHASMAGYTGFSIGAVKGPNAIIPIKCINNSAKRRIALMDREWQRVLASTGQPQMVSPDKMNLVADKVNEYYLEQKEKQQALVEDQIEMSTLLNEVMGMDDANNSRESH